jgi:hypothetical protein
MDQTKSFIIESVSCSRMAVSRSTAKQQSSATCDPTYTFSKVSVLTLRLDERRPTKSCPSQHEYDKPPDTTGGAPPFLQPHPLLCSPLHSGWVIPLRCWNDDCVGPHSKKTRSVKQKQQGTPGPVIASAVVALAAATGHRSFLFASSTLLGLFGAVGWAVYAAIFEEIFVPALALALMLFSAMSKRHF